MVKKIITFAIIFIFACAIYVYKKNHQNNFVMSNKHWSINLDDSKTDYIEGNIDLIVQTSLKLILNDNDNVNSELKKLGSYYSYPYKRFFLSYYTVDFLTKKYRTAITIDKSSRAINDINISTITGNSISLSDIKLTDMELVSIEDKTQNPNAELMYLLVRKFKLNNKEEVFIEYTNYFASMEEIHYYKDNIDKLNKCHSIKISLVK